jgi:hypothetical protein
MLATKYKEFLSLLNTSNEKGVIKILHRGMTKEFAFNALNIHLTLNTIEQFAEGLFFFGEKSRYFWNERLRSIGSRHYSKKYDEGQSNLAFDINDSSDELFKFIFKEFNKLIIEQSKPATSVFFETNKLAISYFDKLDKLDSFLNLIQQLSLSQRVIARNYYLKLLHQLGESSYKSNSHFISSSKKRRVAKKFSKKGIIINFWNVNFDSEQLHVDIPKFIGMPYEEQEEISLFTVILPQFIYSFEFENVIYPNPAIKSTKDLELAILCGFDIKQDNFVERLKIETNYSSGIVTNGKTYEKLD